MATKHRWTKETMGRCAQVFMLQITEALDLAVPKERLKKIESLVNQYNEIARTLPKLTEDQILFRAQISSLKNGELLFTYPKPRSIKRLTRLVPIAEVVSIVAKKDHFEITIKGESEMEEKVCEYCGGNLREERFRDESITTCSDCGKPQ